MPHPLHVVDVFAPQKLAGNPLSVVLAAADLSSSRMQAVALETNHSETTFVTASEPGPEGWPVRIFTPWSELPFAGHPTLGTAWVIRQQLCGGEGDRVDLALGVGTVPVRFEGELAWLEAPPIETAETHSADITAAALGLEPSDLDDRGPVQTLDAGIVTTFIPVRKREALDRSRLDADAFAPLCRPGLPAQAYLFCTDPLSPENGIHARMYFDAGGVREDPATGSAAAQLGAYLLEHRFLGDGPVDLRIEQGFAIRRPSILHLRAERRADGTARVHVGGKVIPAIEGRLL
jgi:trans-2,3-dihydro-3-hydroxyanthranilate isomerase